MPKLTLLLPVALLLGCSSSSSTTFPDAAGSPDASTSDAPAPTTDGSTPATDATTSVDANAPPDVQAACASLATSVCTKLSACSTFELSVAYGDLATCEARFALGCESTVQAPSSGSTPAYVTACATAIPQVACTDFIDGNYGPTCMPAAGALAANAACGESAQCASTFCAVAPGSACGTCSPPTTAGSACVNQSCSQGQSCPSGATNCQAPGTGQIGDPCTYQADCDLAHAVGCNTQSGKCFALTLAASGSNCGVNSISNPTSYAVCPASGTCPSVLGNKPCVPAAADGASCSTGTSGPGCLPPATCSNGTCTLPDPGSCH